MVGRGGAPAPAAAVADDALFDLLGPERLTSVVDVGANPIDGDPPYKDMLAKRLCRVVGFEPQGQALAALNARKSEYETYLPYALGDGTTRTLTVCAAPGMSSLLRPDELACYHFAGFSRWGRIVGERPVETRRLDDIAEIDALDLLKIDVQGSELAVMRNGRARLGSAVAVHTEVSFLPLYRDQPLFGDIDRVLRDLGFVPHAFAALRKSMIAPLAGDTEYDAFNQLLEADVVYVRNFMQPQAMTVEQLRHLALVAHHCYRSYDLAMNCVHHLHGRGAVPADAKDRYVALIRAEARGAAQPGRGAISG